AQMGIEVSRAVVHLVVEGAAGQLALAAKRHAIVVAIAKRAFEPACYPGLGACGAQIRGVRRQGSEPALAQPPARGVLLAAVVKQLEVELRHITRAIVEIQVRPEVLLIDSPESLVEL